ncbi:MAG: RNA polymerase subunit sigma [Planctomycetes bacterium]|nr:RNA polymerase subunit sigma [Planctomycetota bacterium]
MANDDPSVNPAEHVARASSAVELLPLLYDELRALARRQVELGARGPTLQATALVHEAYLRLVGDRDPGWDGRAHFYGAAARAMRHILVERARAKGSLKRGAGAAPIALVDSVATLAGEPDADVLALDETLERLAVEAPRPARVVELLHFAGLTQEEAAAVVGVSLATLKTDWSFARAWLHRELSR